MVPPDSSFQRHTRSTKASRPTSSFVLPSAASWRSTTTCVAMPAWSVPGTQSALKPSIRFIRTRTSWSVMSRPWPMCKDPVTFGGGITIENALRALAGSAPK